MSLGPMSKNGSSASELVPAKTGADKVYFVCCLRHYKEGPMSIGPSTNDDHAAHPANRID
jgi:hypothetical protein